MYSRNHRLFRIIPCGDHNREIAKTRFKDCLKNFHGAYYIDHRRWSKLAENRDAWRITTRWVTLNDKRHRNRNYNTTPSNPEEIFRCSYCNHACLSCIGLIRYLFTKPSHGDDIYIYIYNAFCYIY